MTHFYSLHSTKIGKLIMPIIMCSISHPKSTKENSPIRLTVNLALNKRIAEKNTTKVCMWKLKCRTLFHLSRYVKVLSVVFHQKSIKDIGTGHYWSVCGVRSTPLRHARYICHNWQQIARTFIEFWLLGHKILQLFHIGQALRAAYYFFLVVLFWFAPCSVRTVFL